MTAGGGAYVIEQKFSADEKDSRFRGNDMGGAGETVRVGIMSIPDFHQACHSRESGNLYFS
jgi:hypothetical protein